MPTRGGTHGHRGARGKTAKRSPQRQPLKSDLRIARQVRELREQVEILQESVRSLQEHAKLQHDMARHIREEHGG
jgi:hypothetical protein